MGRHVLVWLVLLVGSGSGARAWAYNEELHELISRRTLGAESFAATGVVVPTLADADAVRVAIWRAGAGP